MKWVGGKTQILDTLIPDFPAEINNYREIFLGGGSVLLTLLSYVKNGIIKIQGNVYAYDLNEPLMYMYKNIQTRHTELYDKLQTIITEFNECGDGEINRNPANIEEAKINKYCECYVNKFDNSLTQSDAKYYKANGRFPDSIRAKVFEASKTCALKILNRKE